MYFLVELYIVDSLRQCLSLGFLVKFYVLFITIQMVDIKLL